MHNNGTANSPTQNQIHPTVQRIAEAVVPLQMEHLGQTAFGVSPANKLAGAIHDTLHPLKAADRKASEHQQQVIGRYLDERLSPEKPDDSQRGILAKVKARAAERIANRAPK